MPNTEDPYEQSTITHTHMKRSVAFARDGHRVTSSSHFRWYRQSKAVSEKFNWQSAFLRLLLSMNLLVRLSVVSTFILPLITGWAGTQQEPKAVEQPPAKTTEPWQITVGAPGWLAGVSGTTGFHGINSNVDVGVGQILKHINVIFSLSGEVRRGRFGVLGDVLYLNVQDGTGEGSGLVSKVDLGLQQFLGEFFGSYRVIEGSRGWLDLLAGFRYTYLGEQVGLQANNLAINTASTQLVDQFAEQLATPGSDLRTLSPAKHCQ